MTHAIRIHKTGGPEVLTWEELPLGKPGQGEVRIRHTAIGLNYIDAYHRSGLNPLPLPTTIGMEAAGVIEEIGPGVADLIGEAARFCLSPPNCDKFIFEQGHPDFSIEQQDHRMPARMKLWTNWR